MGSFWLQASLRSFCCLLWALFGCGLLCGLFGCGLLSCGFFGGLGLLGGLSLFGGGFLCCLLFWGLFGGSFLGLLGLGFLCLRLLSLLGFLFLGGLETSLNLDEFFVGNQFLDSLTDEGRYLDYIDLVVGSDVLLDGGQR